MIHHMALLEQTVLNFINFNLNKYEIISKQVIEEGGDEGFEHLPDNILSQGVEFLRKDSVAINKKAYTME